MHEVPTGGVPRISYHVHDGRGVPGDLEPRELVDVIFRDGTERTNAIVSELRWARPEGRAHNSDIVFWCRSTGTIADPARKTTPRNEAVDPRARKHSHYFKDVSRLDTVDVYRVLSLFNVTDQALGHAIKKLLVAGGRGAGKDVTRDVQEAVDTLQRFLEMRNEDCIGE